MLKIRDNVDLKELEKYGFELKYSYINGSIITCIKKAPFNLVNHLFDIEIDTEIKQLMIKSFSNASFINTHSEIEEFVENTLYDLIKDGLVEKVEER